jgi:ABC-type glutathione transport system ATPase component
LISHDMGVVAEVADRIAVMKDGAIVETGPVRRVFTSPSHPYTRQLIDAVPSLRRSAPARESVATEDGEFLKVRDLVKHYPVTRGFLRRRTKGIRAVDGSASPSERRDAGDRR